MTDTSRPLGAFLRARRELADSAELGLPTTGHRRMPGLRREEVATLAGVSSDRLDGAASVNPSTGWPSRSRRGEERALPAHERFGVL